MRFRGETVEKVTLKTREQTSTNDHNEPVYDWDSNDETVYADFMDRHGKESEQGGQIVVIQDTRCKMRYRSDLDPHVLNNKPETTKRIVRGTTIYDITSSAKINRQELHLMLERRDNV